MKAASHTKILYFKVHMYTVHLGKMLSFACYNDHIASRTHTLNMYTLHCTQTNGPLVQTWCSLFFTQVYFPASLLALCSTKQAHVLYPGSEL